jgi:translation initiation factor IF-3
VSKRKHYNARYGSAGRWFLRSLATFQTLQEGITISRLVRDHEPSLENESVRLIASNNEQLGILPIGEARTRAKAVGMDLVLVSDETTPPVCRLMNFGKAQYEKKRQLREQRKKNHVHRNKEIKFHVNIDPHDYSFKVTHIKQFLDKGHRVKVSLFYRGRENAHREKGMELMKQIIVDIADLATVENPPRMVGRNLSMLLSPTKH